MEEVQVELAQVGARASSPALGRARAVVHRGLARDRGRGLAPCSCSAAAEKSEVLAWPRRAFGRSPKYTVTPMPLSRLCSMVSGSSLRTVTDRP